MRYSGNVLKKEMRNGELEAKRQRSQKDQINRHLEAESSYSY